MHLKYLNSFALCIFMPKFNFLMVFLKGWPFLTLQVVDINLKRYIDSNTIIQNPCEC